jgi:hypothetical protein
MTTDLMVEIGGAKISEHPGTAGAGCARQQLFGAVNHSASDKAVNVEHLVLRCKPALQHLI